MVRTGWSAHVDDKCEGPGGSDARFTREHYVAKYALDCHNELLILTDNAWIQKPSSWGVLQENQHERSRRLRLGHVYQKYQPPGTER